MSVSLFVKYSTSEIEDRLVPIATEQVFEEYWKPACSELKLSWIPLFQIGLSLEAEDISVVIEELKKLKQFFLSTAQNNVSSSTKEYLIARIENLIVELGKIQMQPFTNAYIG